MTRTILIEPPKGPWARFGKRSFDFLFAASVLITFSWLLVIAALAVRLLLGSPIIFRQQRLGQHGRVFWLYKFRSMTDGRAPDGSLLPDGERLTRFGVFLRKTSIDELPQLLNILKGDISLIGPRATLPDYYEDIKTNYPARFLVPQGLTSLPAIRGRNALSWEEKFALDIEYVENFGFKQDLEIFFKTFLVVLRREGVNAPGQITASRYVEERTK